MISGQHRIVLACLAITESASVYAVLALLGAAAGYGASPMNLPAILAILVMALVVSRMLLYIAMPDWTALAIHTGIGVLVIWAVVATQASESGVAFGWVGWGFSSSPLADGNAFRAIIGGVTSVYLWRRGAHFAGLQSPVLSLGSGFRAGVVIMTTAAIVDAVIEADLNIYSVMFAFLAAALAGLGIGRLLPPSPETEHAKTWPKVIGAVVTGVVLTGLFVGLVQNAFLSQASRLAISTLGLMIDWVVKYLLLAILYPLAYLVGLLVSGLTRLFSVDEPREPVPREQEQAPIDSFLEEFREQVGEPDQSFLIFDILEYIVVAVLVLAVAFLLVRAFRRRVRTRILYEAGDRESVSVGRSPAYDAASLLLGLLPGWMTRKRAAGYRLPDGPSGLVDAFRLYYRMLELAGRKGVQREPYETPGELRRRLSGVLPAGLVRQVTAAFERACYGGMPSPAPALAEMRAALREEELRRATGPRESDGRG